MWRKICKTPKKHADDKNVETPKAPVKSKRGKTEIVESEDDETIIDIKDQIIEELEDKLKHQQHQLNELKILKKNAGTRGKTLEIMGSLDKRTCIIFIIF